ncbi:MerR family transcriptional regulator [Microlunatus antarcticus]|uniref:DNA-binding transcriptional MerR regulator n=1 Tax=Microlunatus antarcticus TaxID=53388 RepID=A0A7W5P690_9ACTN|nr:DNA-binding transcriptional MerR regulator [Microlunatus antarcticus]
MTSRMTIGDFARATRLSAKALRFYHRAGVLEPAAVDPVNGYRLYEPDQIVDAQVVRQLRALSVPVETVREILSAPAVETRHRLISAHLVRLESELAATRAAVSALRGLLTDPPTHLEVEHRSVPATPALVVRQSIRLDDLGAWYVGASAELEAARAHLGQEAAGPLGGIWDTGLFLDERGEAALFAPLTTLDHRPTPTGRVRTELLPAVDLAVAVHRGPDETMAQTYGALGAYVAEHELGVEGPVRETYLETCTPGSPDVVTEVGWPIFRTTR